MKRKSCFMGIAKQSEVLHTKRTHEPDEREIELVKLLMVDFQTKGDIQAKLSQKSSKGKKSALHIPPDTQ